MNVLKSTVVLLTLWHDSYIQIPKVIKLSIPADNAVPYLGQNFINIVNMGSQNK